MNTSELRINNFIELADKGVYQIYDAHDLVNIDSWGDLKYCSPIPLTEEWLLKFGAKEIVRLSDNYTRYDLNGIHFSICPERDFFIEYVHQIPIKHVHTLQNFYFATRQQELVLPTVPVSIPPSL